MSKISLTIIWAGGVFFYHNGQVGSIRELAEREEIDTSYVSRILKLNLLAPDIVDAILDGRQPDGMTLNELMKPFPVEWEGQRRRWGGSEH